MFSRHQTQRDLLRMSVQVKGSPARLSEPLFILRFEPSRVSWRLQSASLDNARPNVVATSAGARKLHRRPQGGLPVPDLRQVPAKSGPGGLRAGGGLLHAKLPGRRPIRVAGAVHRVAEPQLPLPMAKLRVAVCRPM